MSTARRGVARVVLALVLGAGLGPLPARAAEPPASGWPEGVMLDGFLSGSYGYNFDVPDSRTNALRVFDFADNTMQVDVAELVLQRAATKARESGFRLDVALGSSVPRVSSAAGLFRQGGRAQDIDLQQAFLTYVAPAGSGLRLEAGKFVTHHGYEVIEGYDGWNDNATRSFLFGYAIPFTHVGVRAAYAFSPRLAASAMVVNGWDEAVDSGSDKTACLQIALAPRPELSLILNGTAGREPLGFGATLRTLFDAVAEIRPKGPVSATVNGAWGRQADAIALPGSRAVDATWSAVAVYVRCSLGRRFALIVRGETFQDPQGFRTGVAQSLQEVTLTPEWTLTPALVLRADARHDRSDHSVFDQRGDPSRTQPTLLLDALYHF